MRGTGAHRGDIDRNRDRFLFVNGTNQHLAVRDVPIFDAA